MIPEPMPYMPEPEDIHLDGGWSDILPADADIQAKIDAILADINKKLGTSHTVLEAIKYQQLVVAGFNYNVKVKADDSYLHVSFFEPLPDTGKELSVYYTEANKTAECNF